MKVISVFNNKGGVGKTTLTFHLAHALAEQRLKTLVIDLDPQCNLTIYGLSEETLQEIWEAEDAFIEDFEKAMDAMSRKDFETLTASPRSVHFLLKPTEDGVAGAQIPLSRPYKLATNLDLVPGRLTLHMYEDRIATRWSDVYRGDPLAIKTVTRARALANEYATKFGYDYVIIDTSPSLGVLNKCIISTADGFLVPCLPDMFSLYGIRNIGKALERWQSEFETIFRLISDDKRKYFPSSYVRFLGFTIYNAKKVTGNNEWDLALAHFNYAKQIPDTIRQFIPKSLREHLKKSLVESPIGGTAIMHSHSTLPSMAQKYKAPIWKVPSCASLEPGDRATISGNRAQYERTESAYLEFADDLTSRLDLID